MKKAVLTIVAVGVAGGAAIGLLTWKKRGGSALSAAQLVSEETMAFAEFPDFKASGARWRETSLWKIIHEPEVQAFLERPRTQIPTNETWESVKTHLRQADARSAFISLAGIENNMPKVVGGLAFSGPRGEVEALVAKAKTQAHAASPGGKADLVKYKNFEIESFSDRDITVAGAFAGNWYLVANNIDLLKATLDRFSGETQEKALADGEVYRKSLARLSQDPEFRVFAKVDALVDRIVALAAVSGKPVDAAQVEEIRKMKAFAATTRFEGERIRDSYFILSPNAARTPTLSGGTLALTSPETLFYYAFAPVLPEKWEAPNAAADPSGFLNALQSISGQLSQQGIGGAEFKAAMGPEFSIISDWPASALSPTVAITTEVRDAALARKIVETCCAGWNKQEAGDATYWSAPSKEGMFAISPTVALTEKHVLLGIDLAGVKAAVAKTAAGATGKTLATTPTYESALATVAKPGSVLGYVDSKAIFERVYGSLRPAAMMWAAFVPQAATYVDVAKLPTTEPISKHLLPTVFSSSQTEDGFFGESTGTVTFSQGGIGIGALGGAALVPAMQGKMQLPGFGKPNIPGVPRSRPQTPKAPQPPISTSTQEPASDKPGSPD